MAKSATFENDLLQLIFNGTTIANLANNASSSPITNIYVSLHNADPGSNGNQTTNEVSYTGYARVAVARTTGGWTVTGNSVSPVSAITFPLGTGGTDTAAFIGIGTSATGTGKLMYSGTLTPNVTCGNGITPQIATDSTVTEV